MKNQIMTAKQLKLKELEINYNFVRKNLALNGKTPAEVAISDLELGNNKWLDLIKLSKL